MNARKASIVALIVGTAAGVVACQPHLDPPAPNVGGAGAPLHQGSLSALPASIDAMVEGIEVIAVGELGELIGEASLVTATADPSYTDPEGQPDPEPVTDYWFVPRALLLGDGLVKEEEPFVLRVNGHVGGLPSGMTDPAGWTVPEREYLLLLHRNATEPPGTSYSAYRGTFEMIVLDSKEVTYLNGEPVSFAEDMTREEFLDAVERGLARKSFVHRGSARPRRGKE